jgi:hypothetical protein
VSEIDDDRLVSSAGICHPLKAVETLGARATNLSKPQILVNLDRGLVDRICIPSVSRAEVKEGGHPSTFGICVEHQG